MPAPFLSTYQDLVDSLVTFTRGGGQDAEQRDLRTAGFLAYQHLAKVHDWQFFRRNHRVQLVAPVSTGTITYDHTGGAYERLLTFSTALSATVQAWAPYGTVLIGEVYHDIDAVKSSTTVTLGSVRNPGADVAAGTSYTLFRTSYNMPPDFRGTWAPIDEGSYMASYLQPEEFHFLDRIYPSTSSVWYWTIMPSTDSYGMWAMKLHGYPSEVESLDFQYQGRPRPIRYTGYENKCRVGTVTISSGTATVTGTSTQFESGMIGSVLRVSADTSLWPGGVYDMNPWSEQKIITAVDSTTSLTVDSNFASSYSGTKYTISDPLDIDEELNGALIALAEAKLARIRGVEGWQDYEAMADKALIYALEGERKTRYQAHADGPIWGPVYVRSRLDRGTITNA